MKTLAWRFSKRSEINRSSRDKWPERKREKGAYKKLMGDLKRRGIREA